MNEIRVDDMTCGHCAARIRDALVADDPGAQIEADLARHVVKVRGERSRQEVEAAIRSAGYTPASSEEAAPATGCCCSRR